MSKLNQVIVDAYVHSGGSRCPFCGDVDIEGGSRDMDEGYVTQIITCNHCDETWEDIYLLSGIYYKEENHYQTKEV